MYIDELLNAIKMDITLEKKMKLANKCKRKISFLCFISVSLCAIIFIVIKTVADDNLNMRQVK